MAETKHTPWAKTLKAAEEIDRQIVRQGDYTIENMATIIDHQVTIPLQARIKELEGELVTLITFSADLQQRLKAEKAELVENCKLALTWIEEINRSHEIFCPSRRLVNKLTAAIAKTEPTTTNPKPEDQQ